MDWLITIWVMFALFIGAVVCAAGNLSRDQDDA